MSIITYNNFGYEGQLIAVEVDLRRGIPAVDIVGLADYSVKETRERIISAIKNSGFQFPAERVLISLSPADLRKDGVQFDLPVALAILVQSEEEKMLHSQDETVMVLGELELSGRIRPVKGITAALQTAVDNGIKYAIIPKTEENIPDGILVCQVNDLTEAFNALNNVDEEETEVEYQVLIETQKKEKKLEVEFAEYDKNNLDTIEGHNGMKYAMAVAVAGRHHLLAYGAPGCGKTLMLQHLPELMPKLTEEEAESVNRIYSLAGLNYQSIQKKERPFRMPHQTSSLEGMCGGGANCRPGEISLAHNGVLFLDEAAEFRTSVLQMLRVPLESGNVTLSRAGRNTTYPSKFQLVMAVNPCPCGNFGNENKICLCSAKSVELYWKKFSAPLLDRVGIRINVQADKVEKNYTLEELRDMIKKARKRQLERQGVLNQDLEPLEVVQYIKIPDEAKKLLETLEMEYSTRTIVNILRIARTIADFEPEAEDPNFVSLHCVEEAIKLHGKMPAEELL